MSITGTPTITGWVDVCNRALGKVGTDLIESLTDGTDNQIYCSLFINESVAEVLEAFGYQANLKQIELAVTVTPPLLDFNFAYDLPLDFLRLKEVITESDGPWSIGGNLLLTDAEEVFLKYYLMPTTPVGLSPHIILAIVLGLAVKISTAISADNELYTKLERAYLRAINQSKLKEVQNLPDITYQESMGFTFYDELR